MTFRLHKLYVTDECEILCVIDLVRIDTLSNVIHISCRCEVTEGNQPFSLCLSTAGYVALAHGMCNLVWKQIIHMHTNMK
jgi:hypothetical protein